MSGVVDKERETETHVEEITEPPLQKPGKFKHFLKWLARQLQYKKINGSYLEEVRGALLVIATLIAGLTFNPAITPPGGLWQATSSEGPDCSSKDPCISGESIMAHKKAPGFLNFSTLNTHTFMTSLFIMFVLLNFSIKNYFFTLLLSLSISTLLILLSLSYIGAIYQITPERILSQGYSRIVLPIYAFIFVICVVMLYHLTYCILYICKHIYQIVKNMRKV